MSDIGLNLFSISILLSSMFLFALLFHLLLKHRDKVLRLPIEKEQLQRIPALSIQNQIQDLQLNLMGSLLMAVVVTCVPFAIVGIQSYFTANQFPYIFTVFIIIGLIYQFKKLHKTFNQLTKLRVGHTAEIATANSLIGLQSLGYQVFHDVQADGFNIDHLVVGRNGAFAIETKGRHKWAKDKNSGKKDYELIVKNRTLQFPSWQETKPIEQASRQAKWVSQWLTISSGLDIPLQIMPILVFPGWYIVNKTKPPFPILNHKQLVKTLPMVTGQKLDQEQINAISYQIAQRCLASQ